MKPASQLAPSAVARAVVLAVAGDTAMVRLHDGATVRASVDVDAHRAGETVVVARDAGGWFALSSPTVRARDGSSARLEGDALVVRDAEGRPLVAYADGQLVVHTSGDLALSAGGRGSIRGGDGVQLACEGSAVTLGPELVHVQTPSLEAEGERATLRTEQARLTARAVESSIGRLVQTVEVVELEAQRVVERMRRVYREVEELSHLRAGRIRQIADGAMHLLSGRVVMRAEEDVAIKGEKIHLA
ncbi:MAG: DUF3540 domain-containing protein [Sandaracinaceae bacterium]